MILLGMQFQWRHLIGHKYVSDSDACDGQLARLAGERITRSLNLIGCSFATEERIDHREGRCCRVPVVLQLQQSILRIIVSHQVLNHHSSTSSSRSNNTTSCLPALEQEFKNSWPRKRVPRKLLLKLVWVSVLGSYVSWQERYGRWVSCIIIHK